MQSSINLEPGTFESLNAYGNFNLGDFKKIKYEN